MRKASLFFLTAAFAFGAAHVFGEAEAPAGPSYKADLEPVLRDQCMRCHDDDAVKGELNLEPGKGYENLVNRPSSQIPALKLVVPGDPTQSYLWLKLQGTASVGKGMPRTLFGWKKLKPDLLGRFEEWIRSGARP